MADLKAWRKAHMFKRYYGVEWVENEATAEAWDEVQEYIANVNRNIKKGRGLLLVGRPGTGKTLLAHIILNAALDVPKFKGGNGFEPLGHRWNVDCMSIADFQRLLMQKMDALDLVKKGDDQAVATYREVEDRICGLHGEYAYEYNCHLLLLDDVGKEHTTATRFIEDQFDYLVRCRGNRGLATILTSNLAVPEWSASYSSSMASYIYDVCSVIPVQGNDHRRANVRRSSVMSEEQLGRKTRRSPIANPLAEGDNLEGEDRL